METRTRTLCPVATAYLDALEAGLPEIDRRRVLAPLRTRLNNSRLSAGSSVDKAAAAVDWLQRSAAPVWLEAAGTDPQLLATLRALPAIRGESNTRRLRLTVERSLQAVLRARMLACNAAWHRSRAAEVSLLAEGAAMVGSVLPHAERSAFDRSGYGAALAAVDRAPPVQRWALLRDHLVGLAQAAVATLAWDAAWSTARGSEGWRQAFDRRLDRELELLIGQLQPQSIHLGGILVAS